MKKFNFYYIIYIFSKYEWVFLLKNKEVITITNVFQKNFYNTGCKPNKIGLDKDLLYSRSVKPGLQEHAVIHIKGQSKCSILMLRQVHTLTYFGVEENDTYPKFKVCDNVRISKLKKNYMPNWSETLLSKNVILCT